MTIIHLHNNSVRHHFLHFTHEQIAVPKRIKRLPEVVEQGSGGTSSGIRVCQISEEVQGEEVGWETMRSMRRAHVSGALLAEGQLQSAQATLGWQGSGHAHCAQARKGVVRPVPAPGHVTAARLPSPPGRLDRALSDDGTGAQLKSSF